MKEKYLPESKKKNIFMKAERKRSSEELEEKYPAGTERNITPGELKEKTLRLKSCSSGN